LSGNQLHLIVTATTLSDHTALLSLQSTSKNVWPRAHATWPHDGCGLGRKRGCGCVGAWVCGCDAQSCFSFSPFHTLRQGRADTQLNTAPSALGAGDVAAALTRTLDMNTRDTRHHEHVDDPCIHMSPKTEVTGHSRATTTQTHSHLTAM
jgi:hypothetical protein